MLLVCPSCNTRYVVPDAAITGDGRQVRCANCKHGWHQSPMVAEAPPAPKGAAPRAGTASPATDTATNIAESAASAPSDRPAEAPPGVPPVQKSEQQGFAGFDKVVEEASNPSDVESDESRDADATEAFAESAAPAFAETPPPEVPGIQIPPEPEQSQFAHEPPFKPRRNPAKLWTMAAAAFAGVVLLIGAAIWYFGLPQGSFSGGGNEPDLKIVLHNNDLSEQPDGTPFYIASGTIVNPTSSDQSVPDMLITLKDAGGRPVYSWKMKPKVGELKAGGKLEFSEARLDVPMASAKISASWVLQNN